MKFDARLDVLIYHALGVFTQDGVEDWLLKPNPKFDYQPPIMCLRSDKDLQKVLDILAAIEHGFPA